MTEKVIETTNGWYMENEKEKVELEDIIGLVQTDEQTNSVQLKKEAQLSICEKRLIELEKENEQLKSKNRGLQSELQIFKKDVEHSNLQMNKLADENEQLKSENKRLTDKLNKTALELVGECISQGKATEISEMSYREFLDYRAKNGKPMELQK